MDSSVVDHPGHNAAASEAKLRRIGAYLAAVALGSLFGLTVTLLIIRQFGPGSLPDISDEGFRAARERWSSANVGDYDLEVVVRTRESTSYRVEVRGGIVQAAFRDDKPSRQQRTWGTWSVQGMFETIERDLGAVELHRRGGTVPGTPQLALQGVFDVELGYPRRYQRTEMRRFQANQEVSWEVIKFDRKD